MIAKMPGKLDWRGVLKMRAASLTPNLLNSPELIGPSCVGAKHNAKWSDVCLQSLILVETSAGRRKLARHLSLDDPQ
jgi:hypothetical protein